MDKENLSSLVKERDQIKQNKKNKNKIKNSKKNQKIKIGGMATFNGVLLKSNKRQVVTSKIGETASVEIIQNSPSKILIYIPILRGIVSLFTSITYGIPYIVKSAESIINNIVKNKTEKITISRLELVISFVLVFIIFALFWVSLPIIASLLISNPDYRWIIQILLKTLLFAIYLASIKRVAYLDELFEYHGAEHIVINYYENNVKEVNNMKSILDINLDKVASYSKLHKRCGSNYLMHFFIISIIITILIPSSSIMYKTIAEILAFPLIIGLAYETLNVASYIPKKLDFLLLPTMYIQSITTKFPSKDKLLIAMASLLELTNTHISLRGYIKQYRNKNLKRLEVNENDIMRLISYTLKIDKNYLYTNLDDKKLDIAEQINIKNTLDRYYIKHEPLQYILGYQAFYKEEYIVNKNVLIPREDTEILVETAIRYINNNNLKHAIDMCTGSGAAGISTAINSNIQTMLLADISKKALEVASANIIKNNISEKCNIMKSDLFTVCIENNLKYDIIITNPPYIKSEEISKLSKYVQKEPIIALSGGKTGLDFYERIFKEAKQVLNNDSYIILEIGYDQKEDIINIIKNYKEYTYIECLQDIENKDRVIVCHFLQI